MRKEEIRNIKAVCGHCLKPILVSKRRIRQGVGHYFCSLSCSAKHRHSTSSQYGELNGNWKGGISKNYYRYKQIQKQRYPEKLKARELAYSAIRSGKIKRGICEVCGSENVDAHHDDYSKPLDVRWFCDKHHRDKHNGRH